MSISSRFAHPGGFAVLSHIMLQTFWNARSGERLQTRATRRKRRAYYHLRRRTTINGCRELILVIA
jgi:hypothetical protein